MRDPFENQVLRAALADLTSRVAPALTDPRAAASLGMTCRLLAHVLCRADEAELANPKTEVAALQAEEAREDAALAAGNAPAGGGADLSVEALTAYVAARLPGAKVEAIEATLGGFSKRTLLLRLSGAPQWQNGLVIRCDEVGGPVESASADEFDVISLMHRHGVPVAEPLWADHKFPFGGTALCARRIAGSSAFDVTGAALGPMGPQAARELARVLAQVHAVPVTELDASAGNTPQHVQQYVAQNVAAYQSQWKRNPGRPSPLLDAAFDYLLSNVPARLDRAVIVHGDASLRNLLLDGERTSGLVDWELSHLGDRHEDLAYCRPDVEQAMPWSEFVSAYRSHGGAALDDGALAYFGLFGSVRNAVFGSTIIHHFSTAPRPEGRFAFAASYLARKLMPDIEQRLAALRSNKC